MIRSLHPYPAMKDSGVPWLGLVPAHWDARRLKFAFDKIVGGSTPSSSEATYWDGDVVWITPADVSKIAHLKTSQRRITREGLSACSAELVPSGSIVVTSRAPVGNVALAEVALCTNQGCKALVPAHGVVHPVFGFHVLTTLKRELQSLAMGTTFTEISTGCISDVRIPLPPPEEQAAIVRFLDHATRRIGKAIRAKQKLIKLLEEEKQVIIHHAITRGLDPNVRLKPSGVEWLGDVPEHWEVRRLRYLINGRLTYGANAAAEYDNTEWPRYLRITDFGADGTLRNETFRSLPPEVAKDFLVQPGDILLARSGATVGKAFLVTPEAGSACHAGYLIRARPRRSLIQPEFLFAFTQSSAFAKWKDASFIISTIQNISADRYAALPVPLPPLNEQASILHFLEGEIAAIRAAFSNVQREIKLLREYRTCLIADVVTGKLDVREAAAQLPDEAPESEIPEELEITAGGVEDVADAEPADAMAEKAEAM